MELQPPSVQPFVQFSRHENAWSDHYGAMQVAAAHAGLQLPERYFVRGIWQHGCFGPWQDRSPGVLCYNAPDALKRPVRVAREEQVALLRQAGYQDVRAIGLPIAYTPDPGVERLAGSLLVVPTHTLAGDEFADRTPFERYAAEIAEQAAHFSRVTVCVHPACQQNGLWVKEFSARGYEIVFGAATNDRNALRRMRWLFARHETVTTNGWGSHVAYALAFGARVSLHGTQPRRSEADYLRDTTWAADPEALKRELSDEAARRERETLAALYVAPPQAVADIAWGRALIGADHVLAPAEMAAELGAMLDDTLAPRATGGAVSATAAKPATKAAARRPRVLFVSHEATRTGAPMFLLHFLRWLRRETELRFEVLVNRGGPLEAEFAKVALVHQAADFAQRAEPLAGFDLVYANTLCCSELLDSLPLGGVPVITHAHELDFGYEWLGARRLGAIARHTSHFIACAKIVAERMHARFGIPEDDISVHYEMIDAARIDREQPADEAALRLRYDLPADAVTVVGCGTVDFRKGVDLFVQVVRRVKARLGPGRPVRGVWIGAATVPDLWRLVNQDIRKMGMQHEIKLVGEQANPHALLALGHVFCLTSRDDPFPLAMLEAAAHGKPVVCFAQAGGADEFCALGGGLAVPYLDIEGMAEACCALAADEARRAAMGRAGAELVRTRFTVEVIAPGIWETLRTRLQQRDERAATVAQRNRPVGDFLARWPADEPLNRAYVALSVNRAKVRHHAQGLLRSGRRQEAIQTLVKSVSADLATKDAAFICEALIEIGDDLLPLDAKQATLFHNKAAQVAQQARISLELFRRKKVAA